MEIKVNLIGMKEVEKAVENAQKCMDELRKAVADLNRSLDNVGVEITQPQGNPRAE